MPERMPTQTPASNEATDLDDALDEESKKRNWTVIFTSMDPLRAKVWKSLDKNSWDMLEGLYELFRFYREPTRADIAEVYRSAKNLKEAKESIPSIKWQIPAIVPITGQLGKEILNKVGITEGETAFIDEIKDYTGKTTGINALAGAFSGNEEAVQDFYKLVDEDPMEFWGWIAALLGPLGAAKGAGKTAKTLRIASKVTDILDSPLIEGSSALTKSVLKPRNLRLPPDMSKVPIEVKHGKDMETGEALKSTVTHEEMTKRVDLDAEDAPPINYREGIGEAEGRNSAVMKQRFDNAEEAINKIATQAEQRSWSIESFDINKVGEAISEAYESGQYGLRGGFRRKFDGLGPVLIQPLKSGEDFGLLRKTRALLEQPKAARGAKPMSDLEVEIFDKTLAETFEAIVDEAEGLLTISDIDVFRFRFRKRVEGALRKEGLYGAGSGNLIQKVSATLTEDFYDLIENEVKLAPENFPGHFIDEVKQARVDYQQIRALSDSAAAKLIRKHSDEPHKLVRHILKGNSSRKSIEDMKALLGDEMWEQLQAGLLGGLFDTTGGKKGFTWDGLKREIENINATDENRLRLIFGDEKAKELAELAEWSAKFASEADSTKGASTAFINKLVEEGKIPDLLHRFVDIVHFRNTGIAPKAASVTTAAVKYLGKTLLEQYLTSDQGLKWIREGRKWKVATKDNEVITITPLDFVEAIERLKVQEQRQAPKQTQKKKITSPIRPLMGERHAPWRQPVH